MERGDECQSAISAWFQIGPASSRSQRGLPRKPAGERRMKAPPPPPKRACLSSLAYKSAKLDSPCAENALVKTIKLPAFLLALQVLALLWRVLALQEWLDGTVLLVELGQIRDKVLDNEHWQRVAKR